MKKQIKPTEKTRIRRLPKRGNYDRDTIHAILDEAFICHVGFTVEAQPYVIPTGFARVGDHLYIHGSSASRMLRSLAEGIDVCVTVTLIDGLVLARSAFHHSINYRSVVILGKAGLVDDAAEKYKAMEAFTEHVIPGRWADVRWPNKLELKATTVLKLPIEEASAKIRTGGPIDDDEDYKLDVWAGVLPMKFNAGEPLRDELMASDIEVPRYIAAYERDRNHSDKLQTKK
jgi:nitroimidazol reductase NimA-like FMN-containing flavoprotein (pyridoxamine 5'-phosphate oxidase superfamily)